MNDLWYALQREDRYLYHYTRAETLVDHILPSESLRFSRFQNVNDPRESKDWVFGYLSILKTKSSPILGDSRTKRLCR